PQWCRLVPLSDAADARQRQFIRARLKEVNHGKRQILRVASQSSGTLLARLLPAPGLGRPGGEFAQEGQLALTDDTLRIVGIGANDAASTSVVVRDRAVGKGIVGLLRVSVPLYYEELLLHVSSLISAHGLRQHGADVVANFAPNLSGGAPECPRILAADDGFVGIVIEVDEVSSPVDPYGLAGGEHDADGCL